MLTLAHPPTAENALHRAWYAVDFTPHRRCRCWVLELRGDMQSLCRKFTLISSRKEEEDKNQHFFSAHRYSFHPEWSISMLICPIRRKRRVRQYPNTVENDSNYLRFHDIEVQAISFSNYLLIKFLLIFLSPTIALL